MKERRRAAATDAVYCRPACNPQYGSLSSDRCWPNPGGWRTHSIDPTPLSGSPRRQNSLWTVKPPFLSSERLSLLGRSGHMVIVERADVCATLVA
ncbi:hypothetical protein BZM26_30395 [Paraburkholderia strydomiana]|nr:hypothetical protein BZM26_30395 [Paraburkholderia strydomiana]